MIRKSRNSRKGIHKPHWALERLEERTLLTGNVLASITAGGNLLIVGDAQANQIAIQSTSTGALQVSSLDGTTTINGGAGPFTAASFAGDVAVFMNQGADVIHVGATGTATSLPHNLIIDTGAGDDTVDIENTSVTGSIGIFGGTGSDTISVGSSSTASPVSVGGSVFIVGATGAANTIAVFDANIAGNLEIFSGGQDDHIQVGFDAGLGIIGVDETATGHVNIGGNLKIDTGFGNDFSLFGDNSECGFAFSSSWVSCGLDKSITSLLGSRSFSCTTSGSSLSNDLAFARGWCGFGGGKGFDFGNFFGQFGFGCGKSHGSSGTDHVAVADVNVTGNVKISTDGGSDEVLLGAAHTPADDSNAFLNLVFGHVAIGGNLGVRSGNGADTVVLDGISVTGNSKISTGSGEDHIGVLGNDGIFTGTFKIDAGSGNDKIVLTDGATFLSGVTINAQHGDDVLWVADDLFQGAVGINGGKGLDTLLQSQSLFPNSFTTGNPTVTSIEVNSPNVSPTDPIVTTNFGWLSSLIGI